MKRILILLMVSVILLPLLAVSVHSGDLPASVSYHGQAGKICAVYITGIGCGSCAVTDPLLLSEFLEKYPDLIIIEYEIYRDRKSNMDIADRYFRNYLPLTSPGMPLLIFDKGNSFLGKINILDSEETIKNSGSNECPLIQGPVSFEDLYLVSLPGKPKVWAQNRVLISEATDGEGDSKLLKKLLLSRDLSSDLEGVTFEKIEARPVQISRGTIEFDEAIKIGEWILQWRDGKRKVSDSIEEVVE